MPATAMTHEKAKRRATRTKAARTADRKPIAAVKLAVKPIKPLKTTSLIVRADLSFKALVHQAAELRDLSVSDYVRSELAAIARRQLEDAKQGVLRLRADDQVAMWKALHAPPVVTPALRRLGADIRAHLE